MALRTLLLVGCASFAGIAQAAGDAQAVSIPVAITLAGTESSNGIALNNVNKSNNIGLSNRRAGPVTSAHDLSLFGILAIGIIGLFWVRRHTSEL